MGAKSRRKGSNAELRVAKLFADKFKLDIRRTPLSGGWARGNPNVYGDLVCIDRPDEFPYCVEVKCQECWTLESLFAGTAGWFTRWWMQTIEETPAGRVPLLVFTRKYAPIFVAYDMHSFDASEHFNEKDVHIDWIGIFNRVTAHFYFRESDTYSAEICINTLQDFLHYI